MNGGPRESWRLRERYTLSFWTMYGAKTHKFNSALISYEQIRDAKFWGSLQVGTIPSFELSMQPRRQTQLYYNNINSQLDATIIVLLIISISSTCFGLQFRPSSGALDCVYSLWYNAPTMQPAGDQVTIRQHCWCFIPPDEMYKIYAQYTGHI